MLITSSLFISGCGKARNKTDDQPTATESADTEGTKTSCKADFTFKYGEKFDISKICTYAKTTKLKYDEIDTKKEGKTKLKVSYSEANGNMGILEVNITVETAPKASPTPTPTPEPTPTPDVPSQQPSSAQDNSYSGGYYQQPSYVAPSQPSYSEPETPSNPAPAQPAEDNTPSTPNHNYSDSTTTGSMQTFPYSSYGGESGAYQACQSHMSSQGGGSCYVNSDGTGYVYFK